jgi:hypothetical protein
LASFDRAPDRFPGATPDLTFFNHVRFTFIRLFDTGQLGKRRKTTSEIFICQRPSSSELILGAFDSSGWQRHTQSHHFPNPNKKG